MEDLKETVMKLTDRQLEVNIQLKLVRFPTNRIFNEDQICFFARFSSSCQILSQDSKLVLLSGGQAFNSEREVSDHVNTTRELKEKISKLRWWIHL